VNWYSATRTHLTLVLCSQASKRASRARLRFSQSLCQSKDVALKAELNGWQLKYVRINVVHKRQDQTQSMTKTN
jgi:hypothetical protein